MSINSHSEWSSYYLESCEPREKLLFQWDLSAKPQAVDCFTVSLHSPNGRQFACHSDCTRKLSLAVSPLCIATYPKLSAGEESPIFIFIHKSYTRQCQPIKDHLIPAWQSCSDPLLGLCISLWTQCLMCGLVSHLLIYLWPGWRTLYSCTSFGRLGNQLMDVDWLIKTSLCVILTERTCNLI